MTPPSPDAPAGVRARRANGRRSTGPRKEAGRRRAARNALRHGLAVSVAALPEHDPAIAGLAALIAGAGAGGERTGAARRIAEAEIDLLRIRRAKLMLLGRQTPPPRSVGLHPRRVPAGRRAPGAGSVGGTVAGPGRHWTGEAGPAAAAIGETAREMTLLDRYERRALSRRNAAVRALAALGREQKRKT